MANVYDLNATSTTPWQHLSDDSPAEGDYLLLSQARLLKEGSELVQSGIRIGVSLPPEADIESLAHLLPILDLIELEFPNFTDGRAFTQARELRERFGFGGDIRASGEVLRDQLAFMVRVGFNQFAISPELGVAFDEVIGEIRQNYQIA